MLYETLKQIAAAPVRHRGAPFWAWNAELDTKELIRQINEFHKMGLGGFFMHTRVGLATDYLSDDFFKCIAVCVAEAKKLGLSAYLYDEDRWPSGTAGGRVTEDPRFRERVMTLVFPSETNGLFPSLREDLCETLYAYFELELENGDLISYKKIQTPEETRPGYTCARFSVRTDEPNMWYNGKTYLDTMNPDAVAEFIRITHEEYFKRFGDEFSKTIPSIFSDEPCYLHFVAGSVIQWTQGLEDIFMREHAYSITEHLPELFYKYTQDGFSKTRLDFHRTTTRLFVEAYSKQIGSWCEKHNIKFTGHALGEDDLATQTLFGGAPMRFYEYMHSPGIDLLTEHWNVYDTAKQCTSVARQFSRETRLSETYGCTGWDFPMAGHKALGDWQYALGINFRCQHLALYSMKGEAKRDYPASISYQSPWHDVYHVMEEYFARLGAALEEGAERVPLLVIHPVETVWGLKNRFNDKTAYDYANAFTRFVRSLHALNIDFDFGDEDITTRHGSVCKNTLKVCNAEYKAVLVPEMITISSGVLKLMTDFAQNGGKVIYFGKPPRYIGGLSCGKDIFNKFEQVDEHTLPSALDKCAREVSFETQPGKQADGLLHILKDCADHSVMFVCNTGLEHTCTSEQRSAPRIVDRKKVFPHVSVELRADKAQNVYELDQRDGTYRMIKTVYKDGHIVFETSFAHVQSRLFIITDEAIKTGSEKHPEIMRPHGKTFEYTLDEPNVLVMDRAKYAFGNDNLSEKTEYILAIDSLLRKKASFEQRGGHMAQPYYTKKLKLESKQSVPARLVFEFKCDSVPSSDCFLGIEEPNEYTISLNGNAVTKRDEGFWCDRSCRKIFLPRNYFKTGMNSLELQCLYNGNMSGFEALFILGDFGVRTDSIGERPARIAPGDIRTQGFPYYSGNVTYHLQLSAQDTSKGLEVSLPPQKNAFAVSMSLNGGKRVTRGWEPFSFDLSNDLRLGQNKLAVTIHGSRRNSHGPFYCGESHPGFCGSWLFHSFEHPEKRVTVPFGLTLEDEI